MLVFVAFPTFKKDIVLFYVYGDMVHPVRIAFLAFLHLTETLYITPVVIELSVGIKQL